MAGRTLNIIPTYAKFFIDNIDERYLILQGSRRSGKSISVFQWVTIRLLGEKKECCVMCATYPATTNAIKDFQLATGMPVSGNAIYGQCCIFPNGSVIYFKAFDDPTKAQGTYCDFAIVEEALNIPEQIFSVFSMSIREQVFFLYNPTKNAWTDKYLAADKHNYLKTTFKDNPYLLPEQIQEFDKLKERAFSPTANLFDKYNYQVYYLGNFSNASGKVFQQVYSCTDEEFEKIPVQYSTGMDFGFVDSKDFTTLVQVKIYQNCIYARERLYSNHLTNNKDLAMELARLGYDCYTPISCDFGGLGKTRIDILSTANYGEWTEKELNKGFGCISANKTKIVEGIQELLQYDKIILTESSINLRKEMDGYELTGDGKPKGVDHAIDAMRYAQQYFKKNF